MPSAMPLDDGAGDQRVPVESARERRHAHAVIDGELQRLHSITHVRVLLLPAHRVRVVGEATKPRERVINITTAIVGFQCGVTGGSRSNTYFLSAPVEVSSNRVGREQHERA
jgi:hypothetical protein